MNLQYHSLFFHLYIICFRHILTIFKLFTYNTRKHNQHFQQTKPTAKKFMPETEKKFHEVLKEYRVIKGLSQNQLAKKIGISRTVLSFLENGKQSPTTQHLILLKEKLGIDFSTTVFGDKDRPYYGPPREAETTASTLAEMYNTQREVRRDLLSASDMLKEYKDAIRELPQDIKRVILAVENLINQAYRKI